MIRTLTALAIGTTAALFTTSAFAQAATTQSVGTSASSSEGGPDLGGGASVGLLLGYGFEDLFKVGFGARGGYTLPQLMGPGRLYIGGTFVYHLGTSQDLGNGTSARENAWYIGPEVGYELPAGPFLIRPTAGLGFAQFHASVPSVDVGGITVGGGSSTTSYFYFQAGATALYPVTQNIAVGLDARFLLDSGESVFAMYLTGQYHF